jgi:hypothetical protein
LKSTSFGLISIKHDDGLGRVALMVETKACLE